jgi:hypothetical protein
MCHIVMFVPPKVAVKNKVGALKSPAKIQISCLPLTSVILHSVSLLDKLVIEVNHC